jgi:hypothetical protein
MNMKKTIWQPVLLGVGCGLLVGIAMAAGLSITHTSADTTNVIGFHMAIYLLSAAIGGPLAGVLSPATSLTFILLFGSPEMKAVLSDPVMFWTNAIVMGGFMALIGFSYQSIYEHMKMPARILPWAGSVFVLYALHPSILLILQTNTNDIKIILTKALEGLKNGALQMLFDIFFTSLVFIALPPSYTHPLWYVPRKAPDQTAGHIKQHDPSNL